MDKPGKVLRWYPGASKPKPQVGGHLSVLRDGFAAGAVAGVLSGVPSTVHALVTGGDPLAAARAAGNLLLPEGAQPTHLLLGGAAAHVALSLGWGTVLAVAVLRCRG